MKRTILILIVNWQDSRMSITLGLCLVLVSRQGQALCLYREYIILTSKCCVCCTVGLEGRSGRRVPRSQRMHAGKSALSPVAGRKGDGLVFPYRSSERRGQPLPLRRGGDAEAAHLRKRCSVFVEDVPGPDQSHRPRESGPQGTAARSEGVAPPRLVARPGP